VGEAITKWTDAGQGETSVPRVQMEQLSMKTSLQVIPQEFADRKRGRFDVLGFLAGLALSSAIGAVLYIYLTVC
jgi:hypothetical protein